MCRRMYIILCVDMYMCMDMIFFFMYVHILRLCVLYDYVQP